MSAIFKTLDDRLANIKKNYSEHLGENALHEGKYILPVTREEYEELKKQMSAHFNVYPDGTPGPEYYNGSILRVLSANPVDDFTKYYYRWMSVLVQEQQQSRGMFISGYSVHNSPHGMPTMITVCPGHGSDAVALYHLRKDLSAPGY